MTTKAMIQQNEISPSLNAPPNPETQNLGESETESNQSVLNNVKEEAEKKH